MSIKNIFVDADSCPKLVREHCLKMGAKYNLQVFFVANKEIKNQTPYPYKMIICEEKKDAADKYILENVLQDDLVITRDIVFADILVTKKICAINDRGTHFSQANIKTLLSERDFDIQLVQMGLSKHYKEGYDKKKFSLFCACFDKTISTLLRR